MAYSIVAEPWVTYDQVAAALGDDLPAERTTWLEDLVVRYAGEVEAALARPPAATVTEERCEVLSQGIVDTRHRPVVEVAAMTWDVYGTAEASYDLTGGLIRLTTTPRAGVSLLVTYRASFSGFELAALRGALVDRVRRKLTKVEDDAEGVDALSEEGYSPTYAPDGWSESERALFDSLRRRPGV